MSLLAGLLDARFAVVERPIADYTAELKPEEQPYVARAVERRRLEFSTGRACARRALSRLGVAHAALPPGTDRMPIWPLGFVGSITHTQSFCAAAVARCDDGLKSVGIDIEPAEPLPDDLLETICQGPERDWIERGAAGERGLLARAVFCAKECAFKCQFPMTQATLDFDELTISIDRARETFTAILCRGAAPLQRGAALGGRLRIGNGFIVAAMTIEV